MRKKMVTTMEYTTSNVQNKKTIESFSVEQLSTQQLIDLAIDSNDNGHIEIASRKELIKRGKDNIQTRIQIKKYCKNAISGLEAVLNKNTAENKEVLKSSRNKLLTSVSVLDKLQLEWQKYDLGLLHLNN